MLKATRSILNQLSPQLVDKIMGYRAGYTPQDRRKIEKALFSGDLLAVVATNALELGVDIGSLGKGLLLFISVTLPLVFVSCL